MKTKLLLLLAALALVFPAHAIKPPRIFQTILFPADPPFPAAFCIYVDELDGGHAYTIEYKEQTGPWVDAYNFTAPPDCGNCYLGFCLSDFFLPVDFKMLRVRNNGPAFLLDPFNQNQNTP